MKEMISKEKKDFKKYNSSRRKSSVFSLQGKSSYIYIYTLIYCVMALGVFGWFLVYGKSFIKFSDGWRQHYKALVYYGKWLRNIAVTLVTTHQLSIPKWSFSIGYGSDIMNTLHYYVMGDPLNVFSIFIPSKYMMYFYSFLILLRLYLAGGAFSFYCHIRENKNKAAILAGSMIYAFCGYALFAGVKHPYFINPMIYLPIVFAGLEKIFEKKKPYLFIAAVFAASISNFYFFYMIVILTCLYTAIRLLTDYGVKQIKAIMILVLKVAGYAIIGVMMSAIVLCPVMVFMFSDSRLTSGYHISAFYEWNYYLRYLGTFLSFGDAGEWTSMGFSSMALISVICLMGDWKKKKPLAISFTTLLVCSFLPVIGYIFNGGAYSCNRWNFAFAFLIAYIVVSMWDTMLSIPKKKAGVIAICIILYTAAAGAFCDLYQLENIMAEAILCFVILLVLAFGKGKRREWTVLGAVCCSILIMSYFAYSKNMNNYTRSFLAYDNFDKKLNTIPDKAIEKAEKESGESGSFYRFSGTKKSLETNATLLSGLSNTQYYWSLSNGSITSYFRGLAVNNPLSHHYAGLDGRTFLNELASVKYYVLTKKEEQNVPYGYEYVGKYKIKKKNYNVYQNRLALPMGYTYDESISRKEYDALDPIEKQACLLRKAVVEDNKNKEKKTDTVQWVHTGQYGSVENEYYIKDNPDKIKVSGNTFQVTKRKSTITFLVDGQAKSENYIVLEGMSYKGAKENNEIMRPFSRLSASQSGRKKGNNLSKKAIKIKKVNDMIRLGIKAKDQNGTKTSNKLVYFTPSYDRYSGFKDYALNLGYSDSAMQEVTITFDKKGTYSFTNIKLMSQSMESYESDVTKLKENVLENVKIGTNTVTGDIDTEKDKILCLSIPYSTGWTIYVDGKKTELKKVNIMYMGIELTKGHHDIRLIYDTPGENLGVIISLMGVILLLGTILYQNKIFRRGKDTKLNL